MSNRISTLAILAGLAAGMSSAALAQTYGAPPGYTCPPGYVLYGATCQPTPGAVVGGAVTGAGQIVGGALDTAGQIVGGTVGAVTGTAPAPSPPAYGSSYPPPPPACASGYVFYGGSCYPAR